MVGLVLVFSPCHCRSRTTDADHNLIRWHVFTAIGGYIAVEVVDMITSGEVHHDPTDELAWPIADVARFIGEARGTKKLS
jgi:hypothetical protein